VVVLKDPDAVPLFPEITGFPHHTNDGIYRTVSIDITRTKAIDRLGDCPLAAGGVGSEGEDGKRIAFPLQGKLSL
jgi:hypothetical protein